MWRIPSLRHISLGAALNAFVGYGTLAWVPAFLMRSFDMSTGTIGTALALIIGISGGIGTYFGGVFADRLSQRDVRWNVWLIAICIAAAFPFTFAVFLAPSGTIALVAFVVPAAVGALYLGPSLAMVQGLVSLRMRTVASAILLFVINIIGLGLGPQTVGVISDLLAPTYGAESLRWALLVSGFANLWGAFHFYRAGLTLREDLARTGQA
jgi:MFS family permease